MRGLGRGMAKDAKDVDPWRVRIYDADGFVRGAGVLVSDRHILTCAHVIVDGWPVTTGPGFLVLVDFPARLSLGKCEAMVSENGWFPVNAEGETGAAGNGDVAVLELAMPVSLPSAMIAPAGQALNRRVWMSGYPAGAVHGVKAFARVSEKPAPETDWVQLDAVHALGQRVDRGFSGAGVVDEENGTVLGIVVAFYGSELAQVNWMLPIETIERYWPVLRERVEGECGVFTVERVTAAAVTTCSPWPDSHEISVVTRTGRLLRRWWGREGWSHWYDATAPEPLVDVATVPSFDGRMACIAVDVHGRMHWCDHRADRWGSWEPVSVPDEGHASPVVRRVAATSALPGHGEIFAVTAAGRLVHQWQRGGDEAPWSGWHRFVTPESVQDVGAASYLPNRMLCAAVDVHGRCWRVEHGDDGWSDWHRMRLPETRSPAIRRVAVASMRPDHQEIFAVTQAGELIHRWQQDGGKWERWSVLETPGPVADVAAGAQQDGTYECLITDVSGCLWYMRFSQRDYWSDWSTIDALPTAAT